jgi:hypothetical protein
MYSSENITKILDLRFEEPESYEYTGNKPSDELIVRALDLVRTLPCMYNPTISLGVEGIDTVIKFTWKIKDKEIIQYVLSEEKLKFYAFDRNWKTLYEDDFEEDQHDMFDHTGYLVEKYIQIISQNDEK